MNGEKEQVKKEYIYIYIMVAIERLMKVDPDIELRIVNLDLKWDNWYKYL